MPTLKDIETGELYSNLTVALRLPPALGDFTMSIQAAQMHIAAMGRGAQAMRVYIALLGCIDFDNWLPLSQTELAERINMNRSGFAQGMRQLLDAGILLRETDTTGKRSRSIKYRLSPEYAWKGKGKIHRQAIADLQRERMKRARISAVHEGGAA